MAYRWIEHTAELELEIEAATEEAVFADAVQAFAELVDDDGRAEPVTFELRLDGHDRADLLAQWLDELVYQAEIEALVPDETKRIELSDDGVSATLRCHRAQPRHVIKGATYHRLSFEPAGEGYRATVVLDV